MGDLKNFQKNTKVVGNGIFRLDKGGSEGDLQFLLGWRQGLLRSLSVGAVPIYLPIIISFYINFFCILE